MSTATRSSWAPVSKRRPCEACGKTDYCTRSADGTLVKCMRVESKRAIKQKDGATGFIHLVGDLGASPQPEKAKYRYSDRLTRAEIDQLLKRHRVAMTKRRYEALSEELGVSVQSLKAYRVGYDDTTACYSVPMFGSDLKAIGIHLRVPKAMVGPGGKNKLAVRGSRNGLFVAEDYEAEPIPDAICDCPSPLLLLTPEGLSDCCVASDVGFRAIGRPSNAAGGDLLATLLAAGNVKQDVIVVGDRDEAKYDNRGVPHWPGIEGAIELCDTLHRAKVCNTLRFFLPPVGSGKDLREWMPSPTTLATAIVNEAREASPTFIKSARLKLERKREAERRKPAA